MPGGWRRRWRETAGKTAGQMGKCGKTSGKIWQCGKAIGKPTGSENDLLSTGGVPEWCKRLQEGPIAFLPMFEGMKIYKSELWGEQNGYWAGFGPYPDE